MATRMRPKRFEVTITRRTYETIKHVVHAVDKGAATMKIGKMYPDGLFKIITVRDLGVSRR